MQRIYLQYIITLQSSTLNGNRHKKIYPMQYILVQWSLLITNAPIQLHSAIVIVILVILQVVVVIIVIIVILLVVVVIIVVVLRGLLKGTDKWMGAITIPLLATRALQCNWVLDIFICPVVESVTTTIPMKINEEHTGDMGMMTLLGKQRSGASLWWHRWQCWT